MRVATTIATTMRRRGRPTRVAVMSAELRTVVSLRPILRETVRLCGQHRAATTSMQRWEANPGGVDTDLVRRSDGIALLARRLCRSDDVADGVATRGGGDACVERAEREIGAQ